jgi:hypothetical protein
VNYLVSSGSFLFLFKRYHAMRAVFHTEATVNTNHGFVNLLIPEDSTDNTCFLTAATPDTFGFIKKDTPSFFRGERISRTYLRAGGIGTRFANNDLESSLHPSNRSYLDTTTCKACLLLSPYTGKHTTLTANTAFSIDNRQSHRLSLTLHINLRTNLAFSDTIIMKK